MVPPVNLDKQKQHKIVEIFRSLPLEMKYEVVPPVNLDKSGILRKIRNL